jgi:hypothetical protein
MSSRARRITGMLVATAAISAFAASGLLAVDDDKEEKETEISLNDAPKSIRDALSEVDVREVEMETEDGQTVYDVILEIGDIEVELELTADAKLIGVEIETEDDEDDDAEDED